MNREDWNQMSVKNKNFSSSHLSLESKLNQWKWVLWFWPRGTESGELHVLFRYNLSESSTAVTESHTETIHTHIHTRGLFSVNDLPTHKSNFFFLQKSQLNFHWCWINKVTTRPNGFFFSKMMLLNQNQHEADFNCKNEVSSRDTRVGEKSSFKICPSISFKYYKCWLVKLLTKLV